MKKKIALIVIILIISYLYFAYARVYQFIGENRLAGIYPKVYSVSEPTSSSGLVKYVALGDSLSAGVGSSSYQETFVYSFAQHLSRKTGKVEVVNLAQPGATTFDVIQNQLPKAIWEKPDYITLLIGINDIHMRISAGKFKSNYQDILDQLLSNTQSQIILINLPLLGAGELILPPYNYLLDFRTKEFNGIITSLNQSSRVKLIDLYGKTYQQSNLVSNYYSADLFHPSGEGYLLWGKLINAD